MSYEFSFYSTETKQVLATVFIAIPSISKFKWMNMFTNLTNQKKTNQCVYFSLCYKNKSIFVGDTDYLRKQIMQMIVTFVWTDGCHNHQQNHFDAATFLFAQNILVVINVSTQFEVFAIVSRLNPHHSSICYNKYVFVFMCMYIGGCRKHLSFQHTC